MNSRLGFGRGARLAATLFLVSVLYPALALAALPRAAKDRKDAKDQKGKSQIHVIYAVPQDGADRQLDTNGTIDRSVQAIRGWLREVSQGRDLRFDTVAGSLDISFVRLARTDAQIRARGVFVRDELEKLLRAKGFKTRNKLYLVFYDGSSTSACGAGAWPPVLRGSYAALYLRGEIPGFLPCIANAFAADQESPGYWEYALIHEIFHTLGIVASCAPTAVLSGHVGDDNHDLMYAGALPWHPSLLDINRDDYFDHSNGRCLDLVDSPFLLPAPAANATWIPKRTRLWPQVSGPSPCGRDRP